MPWGGDVEHSDSSRPYTVDELAVRAEAPHRFAYPDGRAYVEGWALWRALRRDAGLTDAEECARVAARVEVGGLGVPVHIDTRAKYPYS